MPFTTQEQSNAASVALDSALTTTAAPTSDLQAEGGQSSRAIKPSEDLDQASQSAIEGRENGRPSSNRRAIGIMFGIDPRNLYEAPDDEQNRNQAARDLD
ncbi:hypothetical protein [Aureimonas ureilytica]|uniref:hypothetical protein n=1 Tax=Aureimonas ureilytica TaxID=401562 RepID=UPI000362BF0C|nr:hypothetical protein [Aureimonas ureilytica]